MAYAPDLHLMSTTAETSQAGYARGDRVHVSTNARAGDRHPSKTAEPCCPSAPCCPTSRDLHRT